jgi:4-hydroxy-tetrahydrodipicolinate reductase
MGAVILDAVSAEPGLEPVGVLEKLSDATTVALPDGSADLPQSSDPIELLARLRPDVVIDFSNAEWTPAVAAAALDNGVRLVVGTTGLADEWVEDLGQRCRQRRVGAVVASNFAIGAVLMTHMAAIASRFFDSAEIIELHHDQKIDAPSGTALTTARAMIASRGKPFERNEPEAEPVAGARAAAIDGVTVHSIRLPGLSSHQEVLFGGRAQTLSIRHDTTGRDSYVPGIMLATREVMKRTELVRDLAGLFGLET